MPDHKPRVDAPFEKLRLETVDGGPPIAIGDPRDRWTMLFVYRGSHCPRCKRFLSKLNATLPAWEEMTDVVVVSADTLEKARGDKEELGWTFALCHGLTVPEMRAIGLYVSEPLSEAETTAPFAEPGAFAIRPDGTLMLADISNGPAARPDLEELLDGMIFNITNNRPARGTA